jgi:hypothetical protein
VSPSLTPTTGAKKSAGKEILAMRRKINTGKHGKVFEKLFNKSSSGWVLLIPSFRGNQQLAYQLSY